MNSHDVTLRVNKELLEVSDDLKTELTPLLTEPQKHAMEDYDGAVLSMWTVLQRNEYFIVYNDERDHFGVAFRNILNEFIYAGRCASLRDAYENIIDEDGE